MKIHSKDLGLAPLANKLILTSTGTQLPARVFHGHCGCLPVSDLLSTVARPWRDSWTGDIIPCLSSPRPVAPAREPEPSSGCGSCCPKCCFCLQSPAKTIYLQSPSLLMDAGTPGLNVLMCSFLSHFPKHWFVIFQRNLWLMAILKCLQFLNHCFLLQKHLYSHLQNVVRFKLFGKIFWRGKTKKGVNCRWPHLCPSIKPLCFPIASAGMLKYQVCWSALHFSTWRNKVKALLGFLAKTEGVERSENYSTSWAPTDVSARQHMLTVREKYSEPVLLKELSGELIKMQMLILWVWVEPKKLHF